MGASQSSSARTVSMDNPNPSGVIDISDDVVQRLKRGIAKQAKEAAPVQEARAVPVRPAAPKSAPEAPKPSVVYAQVPTTVYVPAPVGATTLTAMDMRRQNEIDLKQNDSLWRQRMTKLEEDLKKTNAIMEREYSAAVKDVRQRFATAAPIHQLSPCQDMKAKVIDCYRANPGETLRCSEQVDAFRNCVNFNRIQKVESSVQQPTETKAAVDSKKLANAA